MEKPLNIPDYVSTQVVERVHQVAAGSKISGYVLFCETLYGLTSCSFFESYDYVCQLLSMRLSDFSHYHSIQLYEVIENCASLKHLFISAR